MSILLAHETFAYRYFLGQHHEAEINTDNPLGTGGRLAKEVVKFLQRMWLDQSERALTPTAMKRVIGRVATQFSGYRQHDAHELLTFFAVFVAMCVITSVCVVDL